MAPQPAWCVRHVLPAPLTAGAADVMCLHTFSCICMGVIATPPPPHPCPGSLQPCRLLSARHCPPTHPFIHSLRSFYFWVDVIATLSILIDIPAIMNPIINGVGWCPRFLNGVFE